MPELPEVEIIRRGLEPVLSGHRIVRTIVKNRNLRVPLPADFARRLDGRTVAHLSRRGKYLLVHLADGDALVIHLGMTGRLAVEAPPPEEGVPPDRDTRHDHAVFLTDAGARITFNDVRRFGFLELVPESGLAEHPALAALGPEPFTPAFNAAYLARRAAGRTTPLKAFLMDQGAVAGLGNIYACEALHRAGLSPFCPAAALAAADGQPAAAAHRLVSAVRAVLEEAIAAGGSTLRDYRQANGESGTFQHAFRVYGRDGEPCLTPECRGIVQRSVQAGRATFFCAVCQKDGTESVSRRRRRKPRA